MMGEGDDLRKLLHQAELALAGFAPRTATAAELFIHGDTSLTLDYDPTTGATREAIGRATRATARVWRDGGCGLAGGIAKNRADMQRLLDTAGERARASSPYPVPQPTSDLLPVAEPAGELSGTRARLRASAIVDVLQQRGVSIHVLQIKQFSSFSIVLNSTGLRVAYWVPSEQALARCNTQGGVVVDAVSEPCLNGPWHTEAMVDRLSEAVTTMAATAGEVDTALPTVLRPVVASSLVAGLGWMLRADIVQQTPGLERAIGKKLFPSAVNLRDDPTHPDGMHYRPVDDEGQPAFPVQLVEQGRIVSFLHSLGSADHFRTKPNGRALRFRAADPPIPWTLNLHLLPGNSNMPIAYNEFCVRMENAVQMSQPGIATLTVAGWRVEHSERIHRIGPISLDLPIMSTLREVTSVSDDLAFLPIATGCGSPTITLNPLLLERHVR